MLAVGALARVLLVVSYRPAALNYPDTWGYVRAAAGPFFHRDDVRPVGYGLVLRAVHGVWPSLLGVVTLQHAMGLATAALAYAAVRRAGQRRWVAVVPAAVVALSPDFLYFEHSLLSETTFTFLVVAVLYAAVRALEGDARGLRWVVATGALLGAATVVRASGMFLALPVLAALCVYRCGTVPRKLAGAAAAGAVMVALVGAYTAARVASIGSASVGTGWALYGRAAPFADCDRFRPPAGTEALCQADGDRRYGGDFYGWVDESPARRAFIGPPFADAKVGAFGLAAIRAQPGDFLRDVGRDVVRFLHPDAGHPPLYSGNGPESLALDARDARVEALNRTVVEPYYGPVRLRVSEGAHLLRAVQPRLRFGGVLLAAAVLAALAAAPLAGRGDRRALVLFGATAVVPVLSAATAVYNWRYLVPVLPELATSGAIGARVVGRRLASAVGRGPLQRRGEDVAVEDEVLEDPDGDHRRPRADQDEGGLDQAVVGDGGGAVLGHHHADGAEREAEGGHRPERRHLPEEV